MVVSPRRRLSSLLIAVPLLLTCSEAQAPEEPPEIALSGSSVAFTGVELGTNPANQSISISNAGQGTLNWTASATGAWLTVAPASGSGPATLTLAANLAGLAAGNHNASVAISANGATNTPQTVNVTLTLTPAARIALAPATVAFTHTIGAPVPPAQTVQVSNGGGSVLNWTASTSTCWIGLNPTSGTDAGAVTISLQPACQTTPGTFEGRVTITANGAKNTPQQIPVTLTLQEPPEIITSVTSVSVTLAPGDSTRRVVALGNAKTGQYTFAATNSSPWLRVDPATGTAPDSIRLTFNTGTLAAGTYRDTVSISSALATNSPRRLPVTLIVRAPTLSVTTFVFQVVAPNDTATRKLAITNAGGGGALAWTAQKRASWLSIAPASGATPDTLRLSFNTTGLADGTSLRDTVTLAAAGASNSPVRVVVALSVSSPRLSVPLRQDVGLLPNDSTLHKVAISNTGGGGPLAWTATNRASWLTLRSASGTTPDTLRLAITSRGLAEGVYSDTITVTAAGAVNSPRQLVVTLNVGGPRISVASFVSRTLVPGDTVTVTLPITNGGGGGSLSWTAAKRATWLTVSPSSGTTPDTLRLALDTRGLAEGFHGDTLVISAASAINSPQRIPVTLQVANPRLSVQTFVSHQMPPNDTATRKLVVFVTGATGAVQWTATKRASWLTVTPSGNASDTLRLSFNTTGLAEGFYRDTVTLTAPGTSNSPVSISVDLSVASPRIDVIGNASIDAPPDDTLTRKLRIVAGTSLRLPWSVSAPRASWLSVQPTSGTTPDTLRLLVNTQGLIEGTGYRDTVWVTISGASNSPRPIVVFLNVTRPFLNLSSAFEDHTLLPGDSISRAIALTSSIPEKQLAWTATSSSGRVVLASASGTTPDSVRLTVRTAGLAEGEYRDTVNVTASAARNSPARILVITRVRRPQLEVGVGFVSLVPNDTVTRTVQIRNRGGGSMTWSAAAPQAGWWSLSPLSGSATSTSPSDVAVRYNSAGLAPGSYTDSVLVTASGANDSPQYLKVTLFVQRPVLNVTTSNGFAVTGITFRSAPGGAAPSVTFQIRCGVTVNGRKCIEWTISKAAAWLSATPVSGATSSSPTDVTITANGGGLGEGTYTDTIVVTAQNDVTGSPYRIPVEFVYSRGVIVVPPDTLKLIRNTGSAFNTTFTVGNNGGAPMTWSAADNVPWLTLSPTTATTNPGAARAVDAAINTAGLDSGTYVATVTVTAPDAANSPRSFPIKLSVMPVRVYDGTWSGRTEIDSTITFTIAGNRITNFSVGWKSPKVCLFTVDITGRTSGNPDADAAQPTWGFRIDNVTVNGEYTSATSARGTVTVLIEYIEGLPGGGTRTCRSTSTANWTATRQ